MTETVAAFLGEADELDALVADLAPSEWRRDTPAAGWTIAHQIAHLAWTDEIALLAATDPASFGAQLKAAAADPYGLVDKAAEQGANVDPATLLARWRAARTALGAALTQADPSVRLPWFGPPMTPRSMATARLMETWAHGQDVADGLGSTRVPTERLRDIAHLGVRTRNYAYAVNGRPAPAAEFRIELTAPGGELWAWGPADAGDRVTGSAEDFCLVVTQRRPVSATGLRASGAAAAWLPIAQAFAGPPGRGAGA
ncbi:MAG TPA: TIGR03084 family metal-binding protein [Tetrasphaera sp.]|uniref:TIGR03084 family metal-binding protein n=1 Tax=Nostocoides sp. TaxID=1917966 RepID=UPI002CEBF7E7|nr:TIGR03084 family metal-binding protein [Tetrasphaera sp.]HNQ05654.1 TIGR03084 family metal-binding protein [Tetrasphaera sp.]